MSSFTSNLRSLESISLNEEVADGRCHGRTLQSFSVPGPTRPESLTNRKAHQSCAVEALLNSRGFRGDLFITRNPNGILSVTSRLLFYSTAIPPHPNNKIYRNTPAPDSSSLKLVPVPPSASQKQPACWWYRRLGLCKSSLWGSHFALTLNP